ncbi:MAG: aminopeptidase P N-terminal domain-containing protein [Deltaproteobacteria bacterium]|nr:aminopeptidase P N-terminal domain-containing protein [Deltaproteobacteria bacterium]
MDATTYAERRGAFMERMGEGVAIIPAAPQSTRSNDVEYRYRQDNDLLYLSGFPEPNCLCVLVPGHEAQRFVLFVQPRDREKETWTGKRYGTEGAKEVFGADAAYTIDQVKEVLPGLLAGADRVYFAPGRDERMNALIQGLLDASRSGRARTGRGVVSLVDPASILHEMRLFKSSGELDLMRKAVAASERAHAAAMRAARDGACEYELEALLEYHFRAAGGSGMAYPSIVASGANATILHYTQNDRRMRDGDLVLIDAGAEFDGYCSDVTRTFPVAPAYSPPQRRIYETVLRAQKEGIALVRPGVSMEDIHRRATEVLVEGLLDTGLLSGKADELIEQGEHARFYMHRTGHWLGLDVHDVGRYRIDGAVRPLEPGMVLTVEPGLYIAEDVDGVSDDYRGIGVRIEDDVLVTDAGHEVLSAAIPKEVDAIEAIRREALASPSPAPPLST